MRFVSELKHLHLYSAKKTFYSPVDVKNKKKGAAIFMLTPNIESSEWIMKLPYMHNPNNFISYYLPKNVTAYIDSSNSIDEDEDVVTEGLLVKNDKVLTLNFHNDYYYTARGIIRDLFNYHYKEYCSILMVKDPPPVVDIYMYRDLEEFQRKTKKYSSHSMSTTSSIHVVDVERYNGLDGTYKEYIRHEIAAMLIKNINPKCHPTIVAYVAGSLSGQSQNEDLMKRIDKMDVSGCRTVDRIYANKGNRAVYRMIKTNDPSLLFKYGWIGLFNRVAQIYIGESTNNSGLRVESKNTSNPNDPVSNKAVHLTFFDGKDKVGEVCVSAVDTDQGFIYDLEVFKKYRGKGYGTKIMKYILDNYKIKDLTVDIDNEVAINLYKKLGFNIAKTFKDESDNNKPRYHMIYKGFNSTNESYIIVEGKLTTKERKELPDSEFGIPSERAYPLNDESHVKSAIRMFNHVDEKNESLLASRIISKMKSMDITDIQVSEENKFYKYYAKAFPNKIKESCTAPFGSIEDLQIQNYSFGEDFLRVHTEGADLITFFEDSSEASHDAKLRRYLYKERIRNNKQQLQIYKRVTANNPTIRKTYLKFEQYMGYNLFVDLHYYNQLFLNNNIMKMDKAVDMYWDFMNRLLENEEVNKVYSTKTYMIPIHGWNMTQDVNIVSDYKKSINPISVIFRMARTNPSAIKEKWGNKIILFVGERGYFRVDFSQFDLKHIPRIKNNLRKLYSTTEPIVDDEDINVDTITDGPDTTSTPAAISAAIVDRISLGSKETINPTAIVGSKFGMANSTDTSLSDFSYYTDKATIKNPADKNTSVFIMAPHTDSAVSVIQNKIKNPAYINRYIRPEKK